jgi:hypothetical protein
MVFRVSVVARPAENRRASVAVVHPSEAVRLAEAAASSPPAEAKIRASRWEAIKYELKTGVIPVELSDELRIVPPDSVAGRQFQEAMEQIAKRFLNSWDPKGQPVRFVLMDLPGINACQVTGAEPPLIAFNVGCFKETVDERGQKVPPLKTVDEVALIFAHEQVHLAIEKKYNTARNSKLEEAMASYSSVEAAYLAGFDPRASLEWQRARVSLKHEWSWGEVIDEHPLAQTALSIHEAALTEINRKYGAIGVEPTSLEPSHQLCVASRAASHRSTLEEILTARGYAHSTAAEKAEILLDALNSREFLSGRRLDDFCRLVRDLRKELSGDPVMRDAVMAPLFDATLDLAVAGYQRAPWRILTWATESSDGYRPIGRLAPLAKAIAEFVEARDVASAQQAAQALLALSAKEPLMATRVGQGLLQGMKFDMFAYPDPDEVHRRRNKGGVPISWNRHIRLAAEEVARSRSSDITRALLTLGVDDVRLYRMDTKLTLDLCTGALPQISYGPRHGGSRIADISMVAGKAKKITNIMDACSAQRDKVKLTYLLGYAAEAFKRLATMPEGAERHALVCDLERIVEWVRSLKDTGRAGVLLGLESCEAAPELFVELNSELLTLGANQLRLLGRLKELVADGKTEAVRKILCALSQAETISPPFALTDLTDDEVYRWRRDYADGINGRVSLLASRLMQFVADAPSELFSNSEKVEILVHGVNWIGILDCGLSVNSDTEELEITKQGCVHLRGVLEDIAPFVGTAKGQLKAVKNWKELDAQIARLKLDEHPLGQQIVIAQAALLLAKNGSGAPPSTAQTRRILDIIGSELVGKSIAFTRIRRASELVTHIRDKLSEQIGDSPTWSEDCAEAIREWQTLYHGGVLHPSSQYTHLAQIVASIGKIPAAAERVKLYESLFATPGTRIGDPELREFVMKKWAEVVRTIHRTDDESLEYQDAILAIVERVKDKIEPRDRASALDILAKTLLTQANLSAEIGKQAEIVDAGFFARTRGPLIVLEGGGALVVDSQESRFAAIDFLSHKLSRKSIDALTTRTLEWIDISNEDSPDVRCKRRIESELIDLHKNFWAAPIEARALIMKGILTPHSVARSDLIGKNGVEMTLEAARVQRTAEAFEYVLAKVFPGGSSHALAAHTWARAYIDGMPDYSRHIALSALLVAGQKTAEAKRGTGFAIASFLESMGPAETKAGQAAQGHPKTPEDIRADLARLKTHADEPTRWELFKLIEQAALNDVGAKVEKVGEVLGSASLYIAVDVKLHDGSTAVLSLLRPKALERAQFGFGLMENMVAGFDKQSDSFRVMRELISDARKLAEDETNTGLAMVQRDTARAIYSGTTVTVDGDTVQFEVPKVTGVGKGYVLSDRAPGEHFIDLPDSPERRRLAKAIMAVELNNILSGRQFDNDRHGGNCRVKDGIVYHFDFGGMLLAPPTDDDLRQLGEVVVAAGLGAKSVDDFVNRCFSALREREERNEEVSPILKRAQKALISIAEYSAGMTREDMLEVLVSAAAHDLHPAVKEAVEGAVIEALMSTPDLMTELAGLMQSPPITIRRKA